MLLKKYNTKNLLMVDVLFNKKVIRHNTKRIESKLNRTGTYDVYKISLSCFDDKKYILDDKSFEKIFRKDKVNKTCALENFLVIIKSIKCCVNKKLGAIESVKSCFFIILLVV